MSDDAHREAFIAGFMSTGEGYNGEYLGSNGADPREEADKQYEMWSCKRDGGHDWGAWECEPARHGDRERCTRKCQSCPAGDYEFRDND